MATLGSISIFLLVIFARTVDSYCIPNILIRFPFRLPGYQVISHRGYPGFDLSCNNSNQTVLNLPNSGEFTVEHIDYISQAIHINDPGKCLPKRFLKRQFNLSGSPFMVNQLRKYTFYNCSSPYGEIPDYRKIRCLSGSNYTVIALRTLYHELVNTTSCVEISTGFVPVGYPMDLGEDVKLNWDIPSCGSCEEQGGICGFKRETGLDIGCVGVRNRKLGLPKSAKYGITLGLGIPGFLCLIGFACYTCGGCDHHRHPSTDSPVVVSRPQPTAVTVGLDGQVIESYPKFVLGQSGRLPKPNDGSCAICLSEYLPMDTLRSIPDCNHYFHVQCIDGWLSINPTCPLCRNMPDGVLHVRLFPPSVPSSSTVP